MHGRDRWHGVGDRRQVRLNGEQDEERRPGADHPPGCAGQAGEEDEERGEPAIGVGEVSMQLALADRLEEVEADEVELEHQAHDEQPGSEDEGMPCQPVRPGRCRLGARRIHEISPPG